MRSTGSAAGKKRRLRRGRDFAAGFKFKLA